MARYSEQDAGTIYEAAERFRDRCLVADGSVLFEDASLWTAANIDKLDEVFVSAPDPSERSFVDKFRDQVKPHGQLVTRLAAEVLVVYFLFPSNVGGDRKRELVGEVLSWGGDELSADHLVARAFASGVGSGGQGYNTRRPSELWFLIEFAREWKKLARDRQRTTLEDPWRFEAFLDGIEAADSRQLRHMLLHLLFPNEFERIASSSHKRRILDAFHGLVPESPGGEDRQLLALRRELERLLPGVELDFYWTPLDAAWYDSTEGSAEFAPLEVVRHKKQLVLYGPPGTGKTFRAKRLADRIIRSTALLKYGPARYFKQQEQIDEAARTRVHRLQLHPAYSYEDFVRGLHITENGGTEYRPGYLPRLIEQIEREDKKTRLPHVLILDEINRTDLSRMLGECFSLLEDRNESIELPGRDGTGRTMKLRIPSDLYVIGTMNLIDQSIEQIDFALRRRFLWILCPFDPEALLAAIESMWSNAGIDVEWSRVEEEFRQLGRAAAALNREIATSALLGSQYEVGHTYFLDVVAFLKDDLGPRPRNRRTFLWNKDGARRPLEQVWQLSLQPLLHEYLSGLEAVERKNELQKLRIAFLAAPDPVA
jgi:5-methylcytosine-specific restriction enzyme B